MPSEKITALLKQVPGPDNQSLKSPAEVESFQKVVGELLAGGRENVAELVSLLKPITQTNEEDGKARFVLHAMAVRAGGAKDDTQRRQFAEALAATIAGELPPGVPGFVVRELQACGGEEVAPALGKLLIHDDAELADTAAQALTALKAGAAEQFRAALPKAKGSQRVTIIQNLGAVGDKQSAGALKELLADENQDVRLAAAGALSRIGDGSAAEALLKAREQETGLARAQLSDACLELAQRLESAGDKEAAKRIRANFD